jgi:hypothetical protein
MMQHDVNINKHIRMVVVLRPKNQKHTTNNMK